MNPIPPKKFYNAVWDQWSDMVIYSPAPRIRRDVLISKILRLKPSSVCDVGCGNGEGLGIIQQKMPDIPLTGLDISQGVIQQNRLRFKGITFENVDINLENINQRFDMVTCMEVVEHCEDYKAVLKRLASMTEKWLFISVPCGPLFPIDRRVGHVRHFHPHQITDVLKQEGFHIAECRQWGFPFFNMYKHIINWSAEKTCQNFLSERKYTFGQKIFCQSLYLAFKLCLPCWGYQMFVLAARSVNKKGTL